MAKQGYAVAQHHGFFRVVGDNEAGDMGFAEHSQGFLAHGFAQPGVQA